MTTKNREYEVGYLRLELKNGRIAINTDIGFLYLDDDQLSTLIHQITQSKAVTDFLSDLSPTLKVQVCNYMLARYEEPISAFIEFDDDNIVSEIKYGEVNFNR